MTPRSMSWIHEGLSWIHEGNENEGLHVNSMLERQLQRKSFYTCKNSQAQATQRQHIATCRRHAMTAYEYLNRPTYPIFDTTVCRQCRAKLPRKGGTKLISASSTRLTMVTLMDLNPHVKTIAKHRCTHRYKWASGVRKSTIMTFEVQSSKFKLICNVSNPKCVVFGAFLDPPHKLAHLAS